MIVREHSSDRATVELTYDELLIVNNSINASLYTLGGDFGPFIGVTEEEARQLLNQVHELLGGVEE